MKTSFRTLRTRLSKNVVREVMTKPFILDQWDQCSVGCWETAPVTTTKTIKSLRISSPDIQWFKRMYEPSRLL